MFPLERPPAIIREIRAALVSGESSFHAPAVRSHFSVHSLRPFDPPIDRIIGENRRGETGSIARRAKLGGVASQARTIIEANNRNPDEGAKTVESILQTSEHLEDSLAGSREFQLRRARSQPFQHAAIAQHDNETIHRTLLPNPQEFPDRSIERWVVATRASFLEGRATLLSAARQQVEANERIF